METETGMLDPRNDPQRAAQSLAEYMIQMQAMNRCYEERSWPEAKDHLGKAIKLCPVIEALPTLMATKDEIEAKMRSHERETALREGGFFRRLLARMVTA